MSKEIEVKLVLDSTQLTGGFDTLEFGNAVEQVFADRGSFVADLKWDFKDSTINSIDFENAVDAAVDISIQNSDLYYLPDTVEDLRHLVDEYDFRQMQDDLDRDEEAIDDIRGRLDMIEDKLGTDWSEEDNREISRLQERVEKLEEINLRLFHIMKNVNGWQTLTDVENG